MFQHKKSVDRASGNTVSNPTNLINLFCIFSLNVHGQEQEYHNIYLLNLFQSHTNLVSLNAASSASSISVRNNETPVNC